MMPELPPYHNTAHNLNNAIQFVWFPCSLSQAREKESRVRCGSECKNTAYLIGNDIRWISFLAYPNLSGNKGFEEEYNSHSYLKNLPKKTHYLLCSTESEILN
jgi:hypothetical protein